jgi:hypothetical protein
LSVDLSNQINSKANLSDLRELQDEVIQKANLNDLNDLSVDLSNQINSKADLNDLNDLSINLDKHVNNIEIHVSNEDRINWDSKVDQIELNELSTNLSEQISSKIDLPSGGTSGQVLSLNEDNKLVWVNPPTAGSSNKTDMIKVKGLENATNFQAANGILYKNGDFSWVPKFNGIYGPNAGTLIYGKVPYDVNGNLSGWQFFNDEGTETLFYETSITDINTLISIQPILFTEYGSNIKYSISFSIPSIENLYEDLDALAKKINSNEASLTLAQSIQSKMENL